VWRRFSASIGILGSAYETPIRPFVRIEAGVPVADLCRKRGVSNASIYKWKAEYGRIEVREAKRLKGLEDENARLTKLLAACRALG